MEYNNAAWRRRRRRRYIVSYAFLLTGCAVFFFWSLFSGSVSIDPREVAQILLSGGGDSTFSDVIYKIRLPRLLASMILGGALALSGYLLQIFFHNPIAGPFVLGISSGAKLTVALAMIFLLGSRVAAGAAFLITAAFFGSMISMGFVLLMARCVRDMSMLIVSGVMIGYICSAVTDLVVTFADDADIVNLHGWSMGTFSGISMESVKVMGIVVGAAALGVLFLAKPINAFRMGEDYAQSVGVDLRMFRMLLILLSSLLSACVTAFAGPVSFVGIAVPFLMKSLLGTNTPHLLIPACFLGGALSCLICDMIARTVFSPTELGISTVTAAFGAPVVLYMMVRRKRGDAS